MTLKTEVMMLKMQLFCVIFMYISEHYVLYCIFASLVSIRDLQKQEKKVLLTPNFLTIVNCTWPNDLVIQ